MLLLFQTTEKTCFYLKWKKGHNSPKFQNYYKMIVSASKWVLTNIVVKILAPYVKRCDLYSARIQTHTQTYIQRKNWGSITFFFNGSDGRVLPNHVRGTGIKTQLSLFFLLLLMLEPFFLSSENDAKNHFFQKTNYQAT